MTNTVVHPPSCPSAFDFVQQVPLVTQMPQGHTCDFLLARGGGFWYDGRVQRCVTLFIFCLAGTSALAQQPIIAAASHRHSLSMEAKSVATGGVSRVIQNAKTSADMARDINSGALVPMQTIDLHEQHHASNAVNVEVKVRNLASASDTATLEWYFFAYPVGSTAQQHGGKEIIFDTGSQPISLAASGSNSWIVSSKETRSTLTRSATAVRDANGGTGVAYEGGISAVGTQSQSGWIMKGWCVRLVDAGHVICTVGSSQNYEDIAKDDTKLKAFGN